MFQKRSEMGQALVMIALAVVVLFALAALLIDVGRIYSDRQNAQNAADSAALAAALARVKSQTQAKGPAVTAGLARARSNGYGNDGNSKVKISICSENRISCEGMPVDANPADYLQVKITSTIPLTFAKIFGRKSFTNKVTAVVVTYPSISLIK